MRQPGFYATSVRNESKFGMTHVTEWNFTVVIVYVPNTLTIKTAYTFANFLAV